MKIYDKEKQTLLNVFCNPINKIVTCNVTIQGVKFVLQISN